MAKRLASKIGYRYIDTGAMYRAVTYFATYKGLIDDNGNVDEPGLQKEMANIHIDFAPQPDGTQHTMLNGKDIERDIRMQYIAANVSTIAAIPFVRHALVKLQQAMGEEKGIVMDGRDIGTTVFPKAELKIFVTASAQTRAQRRFAEMIEKGHQATFEEILENVTHRDHIDETRAESPLRRADDALLLDNSHMTIEEQDAWLMDQYNKIIESKSMIS